MKTFEQIQDEANEMAEDIIRMTTSHRAEEFGLDRRAAHHLYTDGETFIAASLDDVRMLEYYGGFEYVAAEHRMQVGSYVFYSADSSRIEDHLNRLNDKEEDSDE